MHPTDTPTHPCSYYDDMLSVHTTNTPTRAHYDNIRPCSNSNAIPEPVPDDVTGEIGTDEVDAGGTGDGREGMELDCAAS